MLSPDDFKALRYKYLHSFGENGIIHFAKDLFRIDLDPWNAEVSKDYLRGERKVAVRSGHGVGKGLFISLLVWAQLILKYPQKTAITAPSKPQLEGALLTEVIKTGDRLPADIRSMFKWQPGKGELQLLSNPEISYMQARTARAESPEALSGIHSEDVMLVADEAAAVHDKIYENSIGSLNGPSRRIFLMGNPTRLNGLFHRVHSGQVPGWKIYHVCGDPKYPAQFHGRTTAEYRQEIIDLYGRHSNEYRVRVLGEFPLASEAAIIPWELLEQARENFATIHAPPEHNTEVWGLDVSRSDAGDENALIRRRGRLVLPLIMTWHDRDTMRTVGRVKRAYDDAKHKPDVICVDDLGVGGGVSDRLRELGLPVRKVNVSSKLVSDEQFATLKSQLWFDAREWFQGGDVALPTHCDCETEACKRHDHAARLATELSWPQSQPSESTGKILVEPKKALKARGLKSPNLADAFVLTLAVNTSIISHGKRGGGVFGRRINRRIPSVV